MKRFLGLAVVLFLAVGMSFGQAISVNGGSIAGTITDPTGAVVPGASITITDTDTGSVKVVQADSAGLYSVGPLIPGNYTVIVTMTGFQKLNVKTIVRTGTVTNGNFQLTLGASTQTIEVNAAQLQVNTDQPGVSDVMSREQIETLPINGRNFLDVAQIQPGVILQSGETFDPTKAGYSAISVSGVSGRTTRILLDGQDITDETVGTTILNVSSGSIDEFQLNRSTQDVSGEVTSTGQVLVSTRSGTNSLHGQAFYNFQDHSVGFSRTTGGIDAPFQRNQFGGSVGGPIIKDKLFFFANSERIKQDQEASATTSPTFASIVAQYPVLPSPFRDTYSAGRLDWNGPWGAHFFFRAAYEANATAGNYQFLYSIYNNRDNTPAFVGGADFTTGNFTHSFRGGYEKFHNLIVDTTAALGTSIYNPLPGVTLFDGGDGFFAGPNYLAPQTTFQSDKQFRYDGTWTHGRHTLKYGASMNRLLGGGGAQFFGASLFLEFGAGSAFTGPTSADPNAQGCGGVAGAAPCADDPLNGYSPSSLVLGNGNQIFTEKPGFGLPGGGVEDWRSGLYIADTWKALPSLTLTAGLRWSVDTDRANQDLPTPLCSSVDPSLQFTGCTGDTPLFDQYQAGLGKRTHQPYANFGPQAGFVFSPGDHKTAIRGGVGIFYESDIFNNTSNARSSVINASGPFFNDTGACGGTNSVPVPGGGAPISDVNGVPLSTICAQPIAQAAPQLQVVFQEYQAATQANNSSSNPSYIGSGGGLLANGIYAGPYKTPYAIQFNGGIQHEFAHGIVVSVDYVHNATIKIPLLIDVNHLGAARYLNVAAAQAAIANTLAPDPTHHYAGYPMCPQGFSSASIDCAIQNGAQITDFAGFGLDSSNQYTGGYPVSATGQAAAAFAGANPNVGQGRFILPVGRSGYDAMQIVFHQATSHPAPGIQSANFQASYSFSRSVNPVSAAQSGGSSDQFFNGLPWDVDDPNQYLGRSSLDHTNELSFGGTFLVKYGPQLGLIGHFFSAGSTSLQLDALSGAPGEIFRTDVTGDGTTGDLVPGTLPGYFMHQVKGSGLNKLINNYNATKAGTPTPAGNALIAANLFTPGQLFALNGVQQQIATAPTTPINNPAFRAFDLSASYPIHLSRFREGMSLVPGVAVYNIFNMSNFGRPTGTLLNVSDAGGAIGTVPGYLNGPNNTAAQDATRTQRGSGTFDQGAPRTTEFQLKLNF